MLWSLWLVGARCKECERPLDVMHYNFVRPPNYPEEPWTPRPRYLGVRAQNVCVRDAS